MHDNQSLQTNSVDTTNHSLNIHPAHIEMAKIFSSVMVMGPPLGDKLIRLVAHLFSPEEALLCRHLTFFYPRSPNKVARMAGRSVNDVIPTLDLLGQRRIIHKSEDKYILYPMIPGIFEYILMTGKKTAWHRKYAALINDLFSTGYIRDYLTRRINAVRNIPVQQVIENKNHIINADLMSEMIDAHDHFAVLHHCPCRQSLHITGNNCKRATINDGCLVLGEFSRVTVERGNGRRVSKEELNDIVAERWEKKLVFLTSNVAPSIENVICTCCDCCCHGLEVLNHFSNKFLAPSHYKAEVDESICNHCGKCATVCNTYAHIFINKKHKFNEKKCIGCGNCIAACTRHALRLNENKAYKPPPKNYKRLLMKMLPPITLMGIKLKLARYRGKNFHQNLF